MFSYRKIKVTGGFVGCLALLLAVENSSAQDLVLQWTFDESAGGMVDAVDTGASPPANGALGSSATRTSETPGNGPGFALDVSALGSQSTVDGGNPIKVDTLAQFTFSTWVKVTGETDYNQGGSGNVRLLAKQSDTTLFDGFSWNLNAPQQGSERSNDAFTMGLFIGGEIDFAFSFASDDILDRGDEWLFLAVTYDGNSNVDNTAFFVGDENNAVSQLGDTLTIDAGPVYPSNTQNGGDANARFGIGFTDAAPTADTSLTGYQDDVRVYDGVLDVAALDLARLANLPEDTGFTADFDNDNDVDGDDFGIWETSFGIDDMADADADGDSDGADFLAWQRQFGSGVTLNAASTAVPEPATLLLIAVSLVLSLVTRHKLSSAQLA